MCVHVFCVTFWGEWGFVFGFFFLSDFVCELSEQ